MIAHSLPAEGLRLDFGLYGPVDRTVVRRGPYGEGESISTERSYEFVEQRLKTVLVDIAAAPTRADRHR